jgi:Mg2+ and Co2+ transporter CorA
VAATQVWFLSSDGIEEHTSEELPDLLTRPDGYTWVDVPTWDDEAHRLLTETFDAHPMVIAACRDRNHLPQSHRYARHAFVVLHSVVFGRPGHVHMLELDQLVSSNYLVTVHGPLNPQVDPAEALTETEGVRRRIEAGRFKPAGPSELSYAIGTAISRRQRALIGEVAEKIPALETRVIGGEFREPEQLLEELFLIRHELLTARTMGAQSHDVYARMASLARSADSADLSFVSDLADQFDRVRSIADGESQFLFGVINLYQTRVTTKMTVAMERLAVIAAITLPVTAIASVYGMNVIVNSHTHVGQLLLILGVMVVISGLLLRWAHRQGWW